MALSNFLSKLNWRLILVHFIACWFFMHAFKQLGYLYDYNFLERVLNNNYKDFSGYRLSMAMIRAYVIGDIGLLIGFGISLMISRKYKWFWANSLIVLLSLFVLYFFDRFYWDYLRHFIMFPGSIFKSDWAYIVTGSLPMLAIALCLFFLKRVIRFIDGKKNTQSTPA